MRYKTIAAIALASWAQWACAHEGDDPLLAKLMIDEWEWQQHHSASVTHLNADAWLGHDLHKFWIATDIERDGGQHHHAEYQFLYSHGFSPYWDLQLGLALEEQPGPSQTWGVLGVRGLAPYFFDVDAALWFAEGNALAARIAVEYEVMISQRWVLSPDVGLKAYAQNDAEHGQGSGLAEVEWGLRLRYEIRREFAPYVGVSWQKQFGQTAQFTRQSLSHENGEGDVNSDDAVDQYHWVLGIHAWY